MFQQKFKFKNMYNILKIESMEIKINTNMKIKNTKI